MIRAKREAISFYSKMLSLLTIALPRRKSYPKSGRERPKLKIMKLVSL